jgi:hypothetical protein
MNQYTYDHEIITMSTMFLNTMSDIVVKRFNVHKQARDQIKVRVVYAPKQRVLADLLDRDQNLQLPVMAVNVGGISRDTNRVFNKLLGTYHGVPNNPGSSLNEASPIPIDITYNVTIATRYQEDMDQIISYLLPYINPYFVISWRTPQRPDFEIRSSVYWNGGVNITYPTDINSSQVAKVVADLSFVFKGWIFQSKPEDAVGNIHTIHTTYTDSSRSIPIEYLLESKLRESTDTTDYIRYDGVPPQPKVIEPYYAHAGDRQLFNVYGAAFKVINNVYLSGGPLCDVTTLYNPFSAMPELSADNPPFEAIQLSLSAWSYNRDNFLTFIMPPTEHPGLVDLIVEGPAGYGKLTEHVRVNDFNPFDPSSPEYALFVPYQMPYLSGIQIIDPTDTTLSELSGHLTLDGSFGYLTQQDGSKIKILLSNC